MAEERKINIEEEVTKDELEELMAQEEEKKLKTHTKIDHVYCGEIIELRDGKAKVKLETIESMEADQYHLIHNGFIFNAAAFAAISAVNEAYAVIIQSSCKFLSPVERGDEVIFEASRVQKDQKKLDVKVVGRAFDVKVFEGEFTIVMNEKHILRLKLVKPQDRVKPEDVK